MKNTEATAGEANGERLEATIAPASAGMRFDQALAELFPEFSRSRLAQWVKSGHARLDGQIAKPRDPVRGGARVTLSIPTAAATRDAPEAIALSVLYEDGEVIVVDKPAGLVVHPGAGNPAGTLVNALLSRYPDLVALPRAGIVHRLDKDTSGALVVARTLRAHAALVEQLAEREVQRRYVAVVMGPMVAGGTADAPIGRHPTDRLRMAVVERGRPAVTHYRVRERFRAHTLVECQLETGRTHQIRVHMAYVRHPIVGDPLYGGGLKLPKEAQPQLVELLRAFRRQALHAERLEFVHPASGEIISVEAPLPVDMQALITALREDTRQHASASPSTKRG